jgi:pimeloyl-ACP methyl ester carboxylesterase
VVGATVHFRDQRRFEVPVTVVCPEFSAAQARSWVDEGEVPELARGRSVDYVDINSGHWPMFSRPADLGELLGRIAGG